MENNIVRKAAQLGAGSPQPDENDLRLINSYSRRELKAEDVYIFPVVLCDNDVDRDGERFTVEALFELEKLFLGKTGIFDHDPAARNQTARIFDCAVENVPGRTTATGDEYFRLRARAYMPRTGGNAELIEAIDSGILKEVSVGCAVGSTVCSICGEEAALCPHKKGERYGGKLCCAELRDPVDAYEWSFVAVPAQREAGVVKTMKGADRAPGEKRRADSSIEGILGRIGSQKNGCKLDGAECSALTVYIEKLRELASVGVCYREELVKNVLSLSAAYPQLSEGTVKSVVKGLTIAELGEIEELLEAAKQARYSPKPQLCGEKSKARTEQYGQFTI